MDMSCGNCATATEETRLLVKCQPDLLPPVYHEKTEIVKGCKFFRPKYEDVKLSVVELIAEYYVGEGSKPIVIVAKTTDNRRFSVGKSRIDQVRYHGWSKTDYFYEENEIKYRRERWVASAGYKGVEMILSTNYEIGR